MRWDLVLSTIHGLLKQMKAFPDLETTRALLRDAHGLTITYHVKDQIQYMIRIILRLVIIGVIILSLKMNFLLHNQNLSAITDRDLLTFRTQYSEIRWEKTKN
jgi:hypothetical protein